MEKTLPIVIGLVVLITLAGFVYFGFTSGWSIFADTDGITNFDECAVAGYPIMESYPRQCRAGDQTFVEIISGGDVPGEGMALSMKTWTWAGTQMDNGRVIEPKQENVFTVTFSEDGRVSLTTDCNSMGGSYVVDGNSISFGEIFSTMMYCEDSQESEFSVFLQEVPSYRFTELGELILEMDTGTMFLH